MLTSFILVGFILGLSGSLYNESQFNKPPDAAKNENLDSLKKQPIQQPIATQPPPQVNNQEMKPQVEDNANSFNMFKGCWEGPYAGGKRTIVICFETINGNEVKGTDQLILPSGEKRPITTFSGSIFRNEETNTIQFSLYEEGSGQTGYFEINFVASNPVQGTGSWNSNDGKIKNRDLVISKKR